AGMSGPFRTGPRRSGDETGGTRSGGPWQGRNRGRPGLASLAASSILPEAREAATTNRLRPPPAASRRRARCVLGWPTPFCRAGQGESVHGWKPKTRGKLGKQPADREKGPCQHIRERVRPLRKENSARGDREDCGGR